jgi:maleate isomerase
MSRASVRIGVLTPSSNTVLEPESAALLAPLGDAVSFHVSRFPVTVISEEEKSHAQFALAPMLAAVDLLADAEMDAYLWSGTAAAWQGIATDDRLVTAISERTGKPATTSTLALLDAFDALGVRRYTLVVPYIEPITQRIVANLEERGYACVAVARDELTTNWDFANVAAAEIAVRARRAVAQAAADGRASDAVVIHCTNFRGAPVVPELERDLGIPVLDSVSVGLWGVLRQLDVAVPESGFGVLARLRTAPPRAALAAR